MQPTTRFSAMVIATSMLAVACSGAAEPTAQEASPAASEPAASPEATVPHADCIPLSDFPNGDVPNAPVDETAVFPWSLDEPVVREGFDFSRVISGGPEPDGIRPIDAPCFDRVETADAWLQPQSPVLVVEIGDDRRAYPLAIMTQHEIVNDVIGGEPIVVTYCPLCNSGLAFERTVDGQVLDFGTSGRLYQTNLVMYDRQTKTLWSQFTGEAVVGGALVGDRSRARADGVARVGGVQGGRAGRGGALARQHPGPRLRPQPLSGVRRPGGHVPVRRPA
jgi:hypothetical protein